MTEPNLTPQVPGEVPGVNPESLAPLLEMNVGDLVQGLDALSDDELALLGTLEAQGRGRVTAIKAITTEQLRRAGDIKDDNAPVAGPEPIGDAVNYANMHAHQVDPTRIPRPVLTRDGWVLPAPSAKAE